MAPDPNTNQRALGHGDYTIGWVCALTKERVAATAMLDEKHAPLNNPAGDTNSYTLGSIGVHNVVIACLPKGVMGTVSAAQVATQAARTFSSLKFVLMVGIGGGIPNKSKVRLGDVVVSTPNGQHPSVVQWDFGKAKEGTLETEHEMNGSKIPKYLDEMAVKYPKLVEQYMRSDSLKDILFRASCKHVEAAPQGSSVYDTVSAIDVNVKAVRAELNDEKDLKILNWLTPINYGPQQSDYLAKRQNGSGQWFLDSPEFKNWLENVDDKKTLFCPGIPGAGKTILTSIVINYLMTRVVQETGIAYIYCNFKRRDEQKLGNLLLSILKQLAQSQPFLPDIISNLYREHSSRETRPQVSDISKALQLVASLYSRIFIVVDALDECVEGDLAEFLSEIFELQANFKTSLFATSRPIPEIKQFFEEDKTILLEIRAKNEDIEMHLNRRMPQLPRFVKSNQELQNEIKSKIIQAANGMFLLAELYISSFRELKTLKAVKTSLKSLSQSVSGYDSMYETAMERIEHSRGFAKPVLLWIVYAKRFLSPSELQHALAIEMETSELDESNLPDISDIISVCSGLVTIDEDSNVVRLIHYTTQEYFERTGSRWFSDAHNYIADRCLTYLSYDVFKIGPLDYEDFKEMLSLNILYEYAVLNWGYHARRASMDGGLMDKFLKSGARLLACYQGLIYHTSSYFVPEGQYRGVGGIHLAAHFGLTTPLDSLLRDGGANPNAVDCKGETPLFIAAKNGHESVVRFLVDQGVNMSPKDEFRETPLLMAAKGGYEAIVRILVEKGVNINTKNSDGNTSLSLAAGSGNETLVRFLVEKGANIKSTNRFKATPLGEAAKHGHESVVRFLADEDKTISATEGRMREALSLAAGGGHEAIVRFLIEKGADINGENRVGRTPLAEAASKGHESLVRFLLKNGANLSAENREMFGAAEGGHESIVRFLAENGANINAENHRHKTPLTLAAEKGHEAVVRFLVGKGADISARDWRGRTPVSLAARRGHEAIVRFLIGEGASLGTGDEELLEAISRGHEAIVRFLVEQGADVNAEDEEGDTPIIQAARHETPAIIKLLVSKGANINATDNSGCTPLLMAAVHNNEAVIRFLVEKGAALEDSDGLGCTPLCWAARNGFRPAVQFLMEVGANLEARDNDGCTPLSLAILYGGIGAVKALIDGGANLEARDNEGHTPLFLAIEWGKELIKKLLLEKGVDPEPKDNQGCAPQYRFEDQPEFDDIDDTDEGKSSTPSLQSAEPDDIDDTDEDQSSTPSLQSAESDDIDTGEGQSSTPSLQSAELDCTEGESESAESSIPPRPRRSTKPSNIEQIAPERQNSTPTSESEALQYSTPPRRSTKGSNIEQIAPERQNSTPASESEALQYSIPSRRSTKGSNIEQIAPERQNSTPASKSEALQQSIPPLQATEGSNIEQETRSSTPSLQVSEPGNNIKQESQSGISLPQIMEPNSIERERQNRTTPIQTAELSSIKQESQDGAPPSSRSTEPINIRPESRDGAPLVQGGPGHIKQESQNGIPLPQNTESSGTKQKSRWCGVQCHQS
ncbi:hypothetical protein TWF191_000981 [Orbilia oligospora]|uniref:Uncharacterized protein n=1 Tax=Orbilia oligospora TaxID=2813651 RepID=A0A7C8QES5_ORBOL|nr:hypothetical protein TWF191_000981 [Orbilia oligospora]